MYLRIKNSEIVYPYSIQQLKLDEYNISFPNDLTDEILAKFGVYSVERKTIPTDYTKNVSEGTPQLSGSIYIQVWNETDCNEEELQIKIQNKWEEIRTIRNEILTQTDWSVLPDSPVSGSYESWKTYRQELRNITNQENPFSLSWPTPPA